MYDILGGETESVVTLYRMELAIPLRFILSTTKDNECNEDRSLLPLFGLQSQ